jgi:hypothetical protein
VTIIASIQIAVAIIMLVQSGTTLKTLTQLSRWWDPDRDLETLGVHYARDNIRPYEWVQIYGCNRAWGTWETMDSLLDMVVSIAWIGIGIGLLRMQRRARSIALWLLAFCILGAVIRGFVALQVFWFSPPECIQAYDEYVKLENTNLFLSNLCPAWFSLFYSAIFVVILTRKRTVDAFRGTRQERGARQQAVSNVTGEGGGDVTGVAPVTTYRTCPACYKLTGDPTLVHCPRCGAALEG